MENKENVQNNEVQTNTNDVNKTNVNKEEIKAVANNVLEVVKSLVKNPIETIREFQNSSNFKISLIIIAIMVLSMGIFNITLMNDIVSTRPIQELIDMVDTDNELLEAMYLDYVIEDMQRTKPSEWDEISDMLAEGIEVDAIDILIKQAVTGIVYIAALTGIYLLVAGIILKEKIDYKAIIVALAPAALIKAVMYLLLALTLVIKLPYSVTFAILAFLSIVTYVFIYEGFKAISQDNKSKIPYIYTTVVLLAELLVLYIIPKIL